MTFSPFPVLETERLLLRQITHDDAEDVFIMRSDPEVMKYIPRPIAKSIEDANGVIKMMHEFWERDEKINWGIALKETNKIIGAIGFVNIHPEHFRAEVGYSLARDWHRKGIMREALKRILMYGFQEMNCHTIEAITDAENEASGALLISMGFVQEAYFTEDFFYNGQFRNSIHYGLLRSKADIWGLK